MSTTNSTVSYYTSSYLSCSPAPTTTVTNVYTTTYCITQQAACSTSAWMTTYTLTETCTGKSSDHTTPATPQGWTVTTVTCPACATPTMTITCPTSAATTPENVPGNGVTATMSPSPAGGMGSMSTMSTMPPLPAGGMPPLPAGGMPPLPAGGMSPSPAGGMGSMSTMSTMPPSPAGGMPPLPAGGMSSMSTMVTHVPTTGMTPTGTPHVTAGAPSLKQGLLLALGIAAAAVGVLA